MKCLRSTWFAFDLVAVIPLALILKMFGESESQYAVLVKLFRILRLPKFLRLLDTSKFDLLLDSILEKEPKNPQEEKSRQEKMNIKYISRYAYKVFRLILIAIMAIPQVMKAWRFRADDPAHAGYYVASAETRLTYATAYIGLLAFLAVMTHDVHEMLALVR